LIGIVFIAYCLEELWVNHQLSITFPIFENGKIKASSKK